MAASCFFYDKWWPMPQYTKQLANPENSLELADIEALGIFAARRDKISEVAALWRHSK
jgi:hypothetical protein